MPPTAAELAIKYGGQPCKGPNGEVLADCWRFLHNRDCRAWADECRRYGYDVFDSLDIGGLQKDQK